MLSAIVPKRALQHGALTTVHVKNTVLETQNKNLFSSNSHPLLG